MGVGSALKGFLGLVWRILEGIRRVLHLILLLVIFGFILAALHTSIPNVPHAAALVITPEGEIVEQLASDPVRRAFGQASGGPAPETLLRDVTDAIAAAKSDERIKLIVLDLGTLDSTGLSKLQEIGAALGGSVPDEPAALAAVSGDAAKLALQRGLVTALKSRRQMADELKVLVGEDEDTHSFNSIGMNQYLASVRSKHVLKSKSDSRVGIVVASGKILDGHQRPGTIGGA